MSLQLKNEYISKTPETRLYHLNLPLIGLTGGISTGKSTVAEILKSHGFPLLSADQLVKKIYSTEESLDFIKKNFPSAIDNNHINFKKLREIVFFDQEAKIKVETYIYSKLPSVFLHAQEEILKQFPDAQCLIYDVPLLFEKNLFQKVDLSVCVYLPREIQKKRLMARDRIEADLAEKILDEQWDIELKKSKSDVVIENIRSLKELEEEVSQFIKNYFS